MTGKTLLKNSPDRVSNESRPRRRDATRRASALACLAVTLAASVVASCLPQSPTGTPKGGERTLTLYAFSVMKESMDKAILPGFAAQWKQTHGEDVRFVTSYAGSETITNQILQGVGADIGIFSIERDVERLKQGGAVTADWAAAPHRSVVNKTPFIILVRPGNPKGIRDFLDLAKPGVRVIHPDPVSSGGAMWSLLASYGSELEKSRADAGAPDTTRAAQALKAVWRNVISTPGSAREARTQFETGYGDALITYELEGLMMKEAGAAVEVIVPRSTIFSEHPAVAIDRNVTPEERPVVEAFLRYLWSDDAQRAFVQHHFRSVTREDFNDANQQFAKIELPFTVELFGGWPRAYPEIVEGIWRDQVQKKK